MSCLQTTLTKRNQKVKYELSHLLILLNQRRRSGLFSGTNLYKDVILGGGGESGFENLTVRNFL